MSPIDPKILHAYVDDQLDAQSRIEVERRAETDPQLQADLAAYRAQRDSLRALFNPTLIEPLPARLDPKPMAQRHRWRQLQRVALAASVLALALLTTSGLWTTPPDAPIGHQEIIASAISAHSSPAQTASLDAAQISALFGTTIAVPDLSALGLAFASAHQIPGPDPRVALTYADPAGTPTTLYLAPLPEPAGPLLLASDTPVKSLYWANARITCTIVSATADLNAIAEKAFAQLTPGETTSSTRVYRDI